MKEFYEVRQIDAWHDGESWEWDSSYKIADGYVKASITANYTEKAKRVIRKLGYSTKFLESTNDMDRMVEFYIAPTKNAIKRNEDFMPVVAVFFNGLE